MQRDDSLPPIVIVLMIVLLISNVITALVIDSKWKGNTIKNGIAFYTPEGTFQLKTNAAPVLRFEE